MTAIYNDNDRKACAWLGELVKAGHITDGVVDDRPIQEITAADLKPHTRAHFFAGIGGWDYALKLAGWPDDRPVWTGSCPCQPFSSAGKRGAEGDERHLWPEFFRLIAECRPATVFGEQVASADGRAWLAGVRTDLESLGYAVGAADLCAAGVGAPHIRQRLWWVADAGRGGVRGDGLELGGETGGVQGEGLQRQRVRPDAGDGGNAGGVADAENPYRGCRVGGAEAGARPDGERGGRLAGGGEAGGVGDAAGQRQLRGVEDGPRLSPEVPRQRPEPFSHWHPSDLIPCRDGKARRVEPGTFPLAHGVPGRVGLLRGYGNAIVPQVAATFVRAYLEAAPPRSEK
tara:strand:+ start:3442 stop:4473 length:1032 start_codon:yes stop_codon:yes gene_type:complete